MTTGESVRVVHDLGEWFQVLTPGGQQGLVPASYVQLLDEPDRPSQQQSGLQAQSSISGITGPGGLGARASFRGTYGYHICIVRYWIRFASNGAAAVAGCVASGYRVAGDRGIGGIGGRPFTGGSRIASAALSWWLIWDFECALPGLRDGACD